jgi:hypothetical protein
MLEEPCACCDLIIGEARERAEPDPAGDDLYLFDYRSPLSRQDDGFRALPPGVR